MGKTPVGPRSTKRLFLNERNKEKEMRSVLLIIAMILGGCNTSDKHERLKIDIDSYREMFKSNLTHFQLIKDAIDSTAVKNISKSEEQKSISTLPLRFSIYKNKKLVDWSIEIDSINGQNYFYRIIPTFNKRKAHCSVLSYCYSDSNTLKVLIGNTRRNVRYKPIDNSWVLEVDESSPCID
jgi:hypothetical protein